MVQTEKYRRQVAEYPCPLCNRRMYADQVIDFSTIDDRPRKHHRACKEGQRA